MKNKRTRVGSNTRRWLSKKGDDEVMKRWVKACTEIHAECLDCGVETQCQDLADRMIACSLNITKGVSNGTYNESGGREVGGVRKTNQEEN